MIKKSYIIILCMILAIGLTSCREKNAKEVINNEIDSAISKSYNKPIDEDRDYELNYEEEKIEKENNIKIIALGDIMLGRGVGNILRKNGINLAYEDFKNIFEDSDILFGNLESPISDKGKKLPGKGICLRARPEMIEVLKKAGFDLVSLANNHIVDYDSEGLIDTINILEENSIGYVGAGENIHEARKPYIMDIKDTSVGFLAYEKFAHIYYSNSYKRRFVATEDTPGTAPLDIDVILEDIGYIKDKVDTVIVSLHWGVEESNNITEEQRKLAHKLIDNGVDIILGHHPHVIQPIEIYKGKPIVYSMGNYIFDQNDENNKQGMVVSISIEDKDIKEIKAIPLYIKNKSNPIIPKGEKGKYIMNKIINLSKKVNTEGVIEGDNVIFKVEETSKN